MKASLKQVTLARAGSLTGKGLHSGEGCRLTVRPAKAGAGLVFFKEGLRLGSLTRNEVPVSQSSRCTALGEAPARILTVEHFLAAVLGLGIDNLEARVEGPELPASGGSALGFVRFLKRLGLRYQPQAKRLWRVREPIFCSEPGRAVQALPAEDLRVSYVLDYDHPALKGQIVSFAVTPRAFERELAPARTFCTGAEAAVLKKQGYGRGADSGNTLVISARGPARNRLRFPDECARHKALDLLGDLGLLGAGLVGHFTGLRSGHGLNRRLVEEIRRQNEKR